MLSESPVSKKKTCQPLNQPFNWNVAITAILYSSVPKPIKTSLPTSSYNVIHHNSVLRIKNNSFHLDYVTKLFTKALKKDLTSTLTLLVTEHYQDNFYLFKKTNKKIEQVNNFVLEALVAQIIVTKDLLLLNKKLSPILFNLNHFNFYSKVWLKYPYNLNESFATQAVSWASEIKKLKQHFSRRKLQQLTASVNQHVIFPTSIFMGGQNNFGQVFLKKEDSKVFYSLRHFKPHHLNTPNNVVYFLKKLEEKLESIDATESKIALAKLLKVYNFLLYTLEHQKLKYLTEHAIIANPDILTKIKNLTPSTIYKFFKEKFLNKTTFLPFLNKQPRKLIKHKSQLKSRVRTSRLKALKVLSHKKLELNTQYSKLTAVNKTLSVVLNAKVHIIYINALALVKFGFLLEKQKSNLFLKNLSKNPSKFLNNLDREMINKYKYIGVYIKDLIRVCFISLFLKKPAFLAKFIAFQISVLPKNRKETNFIRFLIKVIKTFAAERAEIWGLRIKFKGRVNRWRRTKIILGQRGILPLHTIANRIEYGSAQAVNRKGALGVHIWLWYNPLFKNTLKNTYVKYFDYSNYLTTLKKY